ncbi:MAG: D-alanyl-D-alanine carboxypeptidase family protein [Actinomycetota bacterium]
MHSLRRLISTLIGACLVVATAATPAAADPVIDALEATDLSPDELVAAFDNANLTGLQPLVGPPPSITGDAELDARIRVLAEGRGYVRRAEPSVPLTLVDGRSLQPQAAAAWTSLRTAAANAGHSIALTSAYRSAGHQASIFRSRLTGTSDAALDTLLETVAAPGYSKHHTGYAIDLRSGNSVLFDFADTPAYAWLSADNFANAKAHGWMPSYPDGVESQGPNPEPWEFVWAGAINIICADFTPSEGDPFCDTLGSSFADDVVWLYESELTTGCGEIRFCIDDAVTRGEGATFLWRLFGRIAPTATADFDDVEAGMFFADPVAWMVENEITTGTSPTTFSPYDQLTRAQFVTFLWRAAGRPAAMAPHSFDDVAEDSFADDAVAWAVEAGITNGTSATTFSPDGTATRGQIAAFLNRFAALVPA